MHRRLVTAAAVVLSSGSLAAADVLVEFSLYTDTDWIEENRVADVSMTIEGIDLMGHLPEGSSTRNAEVLIQTAWGEWGYFNGEIGCWV